MSYQPVSYQPRVEASQTRGSCYITVANDGLSSAYGDRIGDIADSYPELDIACWKSESTKVDILELIRLSCPALWS